MNIINLYIFITVASCYNSVLSSQATLMTSNQCITDITVTFIPNTGIVAALY